MRLLNPIAWLGALVVLLPIAIHLFSRQPARTVAFPSLRFLDVSRVLPTRRTKLTDLALLAVRLLTLLVAACALTQPSWSRARGMSSDVARVVLIESARADNSVREPRADSLVRAATVGLRVSTPSIANALPGALGWLRLQQATRELVVLTASAGGSLDSLDIARIPSDVRVMVTPRLGVDTPTPTRVVLWSGRGSNTNERDTRVANAARTAGATQLRERVSATETLAIVVASPDADSVTAWRDQLRPLNAAWMGDAIARLHADTTVAATLGTMSPGALAMRDSTVATPWSVVVRAASGAPALLAATHGAQLLLVVRADGNEAATDMLRAAVLLAASRALEPPRAAARAADSTTIARWIAARDPRITLGTATATGDYDTGPSDARYLWLVVLALLGIETVMRRRMASAA